MKFDCKKEKNDVMKIIEVKTILNAINATEINAAAT